MKKNLVYVYGVNLVNGLAGIAFIPLAIKSLGAEGYGIYSIFVILSSYIYFIEMGVAKYFTRTIAQTVNSEEQSIIMQVAVGIYIRIAILLLLITPVLFFVIPNFIFPTNNDFLVSIIVILVSLDYLLSIPTTILLTFNIGKEKFGNVSKYNLFSGLSKHLFLIATVVLTHSILLLISVILLRRIFDIIYARKILVQLPAGSWKPKYSKGEFKKIISESILLSAAQLTQVTILALGTFLVNKNFTMREVGIYKSVFDLATKVWFFSNSLGMVIFPRFSAMLKNEKEKSYLLSRIPYYNKVSWLIYNSLFVTVFLVLKYVPNFLMIQDMDLFFFLLYGVCLNAHTNLSYEFLQAASKLKEVILTSCATIVCMVIFFYLYLESYQFYTIGIAWVISQFINSFVMDSFVLKELNILKTITTLSINMIVSVFLYCILFVF
ncbi:oligosaccharide flippase family protein [Lysinibacillus xylanilyticus]|uniref:oligosaccharide flippase family protein n=1 Tax=Lysinibacillus xylanilyticus TaxID=582475 RepID=UPI003D00DF4C